MMIRIFMISLFLCGCASQEINLSQKTILGLQSELSQKQDQLDRLQSENQVLRKELESRARKKMRPVKRKTAQRSLSSKASVARFSNDQELYTDMQLSFQKRELPRLVRLYKSLSKNFPQSQLLDRSLFLVGELFLIKEMYSDALKTFKKLEQKHPLSSKIPAVQLAKSKIYLKMSLPSQARSALESIVNNFPGSPESQRASLEMKYLDHLEKSELQ